MKANRFLWALILLLQSAAGIQLPAQQNEADRKLLADIRAKAEKGDARFQKELAGAHMSGNLGLAKDASEAAKWFRKAAEQNDTEAQFDLGVFYAHGLGVAKDVVEAAKKTPRSN